LNARGLFWPGDHALNSVPGFLSQKDQAKFGPLPDLARTFAINNV
jgi:hypothetical protein